MALPFDSITATTLQLVRRRLADNIFKASNFAAWLLARGRVQMVSGGKYLQEPLMYATNGTVKAYAGYERLNVAPTDELTAAQYSYRQAAVSIGISGLEELENDGPEAIFKMLKAKITNAEMSLKQWFDEKLLAETSTKDLTRDFLGIDEIVEDMVATSQSTVGGIDRSVETWWANQFIDASAGGTAPGASALGSDTTLLTEFLTHSYHTIKKNHPVACDLILMDQAMYERYENDTREKLRLHDTSLAELGFENQKFKGATMMWNENIAAPASTEHNIYFLSTEFLRLCLHRKRNFVMGNFVSPYDQDAKVSQILVAGQLTCNNSRFQGVLRTDD